MLFLMLLLLRISCSSSSGSIKDIYSINQILNLISLKPYFFINNKSFKRYIDTLNLYRYRICFYDIVSVYVCQMTSLVTVLLSGSLLHTCPS
jgi:hypothetical protein